jgi:hypothetical protein
MVFLSFSLSLIIFEFYFFSCCNLFLLFSLCVIIFDFYFFPCFNLFLLSFLLLFLLAGWAVIILSQSPQSSPRPIVVSPKPAMYYTVYLIRFNIVDIPPSSQPDRALSALTYGLTPSCNLSQSCYGRTSIACTHTTGNSNAHLSQVSYRNLLTSQYKQGCNQGEYSHAQVYHKLNTHQLHLNAPYKHLSASVATSPVERNN